MIFLFKTFSSKDFKVEILCLLLFYLRGKSRRGDGGHVLRAQVLRGLGDDKGLCALGSRGEGSFVTVKLDPPPFWEWRQFEHVTPAINMIKTNLFIVHITKGIWNTF